MSDNTPPQTPSLRPARLKLWLRHVRAFVLMAVVLTAFRSAIADWNDVPSGSMRPTILEGDRILVNKLAYDLKVPFTTWRLASWSNPDRGDVVIFYSPEDGTRMVKRVIGLPGDVVEMRNERLFINDAPVSYAAVADPAAFSPTGPARTELAWETLDGGATRHPVMATPAIPAMRSFGPLRVPDSQYLVLGDNRDNSKDSRFIGFIPRQKIVGRAIGVALSLDPDHHYLPRWSRWASSFAH